jgi:hypothetical protein
MKLTVVLGASQEASFDITLNDNKFTRKWVEELRWCVTHCEFNQLESFVQFLSLDASVEVLLDSCGIINKYLKNFIEIRSDILNQPQEYFNYLHRKFEILTGSWDDRSRLMAIAPQELKDAIRHLNLFVHRIESKLENPIGFDIKFNKDQFRRQPFDSSDYNFFEFSAPAGTMYLHYAEVGKEFIDLYQDNLPIDYSAFTNQHHYTGEASITFLDYDAFADSGYLKWLQTNGIDPYNKLLGHGKIPLGIVDDIKDAKSKIEQHRHIHSILFKE